MGQMNNDPSVTAIGALIVLQDTAARYSGAGLYVRAGIAGLIVIAALYVRRAIK